MQEAARGPRVRPTIRVATPEDSDTVSDILIRSYGPLLADSYPVEILDQALPIIARANPTLLAAGTYFLAAIDGAPLGCDGWSFDPPGGGISRREQGLAHIRHFAVTAEAAGTGIGRALLNRCLIEARLLGATRFEALATLNAEGFYHALGFRGLEQVTVPLSDTIPFLSIRMERTI